MKIILKFPSLDILTMARWHWRRDCCKWAELSLIGRNYANVWNPTLPPTVILGFFNETVVNCKNRQQSGERCKCWLYLPEAVSGKSLELFRRQNRGWAGGCKGVGIVGANSCGISYNRASQRGARRRIECDTISNTHKDVSTRVTQQQTNICSLYFISTMPLD